VAMFKPILRNILLLGILIIALSSVSDFFRVPQLAEGFADQRLHTIDGRELTLAELSAKKPLLVYFWTRWCNICRHTMPTILELSDDGINVLTISQRSGDDISVVRYLHGKHLTMPVVNDPQGKIATRWGVNVIPTWLIISDGKVVQSITGWSSAWGIQIRLWWVQKWHK